MSEGFLHLAFLQCQPQPSSIQGCFEDEDKLLRPRLGFTSPALSHLMRFYQAQQSLISSWAPVLGSHIKRGSQHTRLSGCILFCCWGNGAVVFRQEEERAQGEGVGGEERRCWHFFENVLPLRKPGSWSSRLEAWIPISDTRRTPGPLPCLRPRRKSCEELRLFETGIEKIKWFWLELHGTCGVQDHSGYFLRVFCLQPTAVSPYKPNPSIGVCLLWKALIISLRPADLALSLRQQCVNSGKWLTCPTLLSSIDQPLGRAAELTVHLWFNPKHIPYCRETRGGHPPLCLGEGPRQSPGEGLAPCDAPAPHHPPTSPLLHSGSVETEGSLVAWQ